MCDKILQNFRLLMFIPKCYKDKKKCNNTVDNYAHALGFLPDCYKIQAICDKAVRIYLSAIKFPLD